MRTRFIHDNFILDVTHLELSWTEENSWFKEDFFLTSSFPFDIDFEENRYFEFFRHHNLATTDTYYQGKLEKDGKIEEAVLEVEEAGEKLRITIRYGIEALPNWNKKLSELVLDVVLPEGGSMAAHAETIIPQTYPDVNYNFPAIHTNFYDGAANFDLFQKVINKRVDGTFVQNFFDGESGIVGNRNIVYPFCYFLYVLKKAAEDAGYTLHGDILTDPDFTQTLIVPGKRLADFQDFPDPVEWIIGDMDLTIENDIIFTWISEQQINFRGYFKISCSEFTFSNFIVYVRIWKNDVLIYESNSGSPFIFWTTTDESENTFKCEVKVGFPLPVNYMPTDLCTIVIKTLELHDEEGNPQPVLANFSNVQLATALPDMLIGEFFKFPKKLKNYDLDVRNNKELWMNLVQNELENAEVVDISEYDVKRPSRKYEQAKSFLLQYDGEYDEKYPFKKVYADRDGYFVDDFTKKENTTEISINGIPLPIDSILSPSHIKESGGDMITTAVQLTDDSAKLQLTKYSGLIDGENRTEELPGLDTLNLYLSFWQLWLNFSIHAVKYLWQIKDHPNRLIKIKKKSKLYSHNNFMFVVVLNRRRKKDIEEIEVEAYTSKV